MWWRLTIRLLQCSLLLSGGLSQPSAAQTVSRPDRSTHLVAREADSRNWLIGEWADGLLFHCTSNRRLAVRTTPTVDRIYVARIRDPYSGSTLNVRHFDYANNSIVATVDGARPDWFDERVTFLRQADDLITLMTKAGEIVLQRCPPGGQPRLGVRVSLGPRGGDLDRHVCFRLDGNRAVIFNINLARFAQAKVVAIDIGNGRLLADAEGIDALRASILSAIAFWSHACRTCDGSELSVIEFGSARYVSEALADFILGRTPRLPGVPRDDTAPGLIRSRIDMRTPFDKLIPVSPEIADKLCALDLASTPPLLGPAHKSVCGSDRPSPDELTPLRIDFVASGSETPCSDDQVIACAVTDRFIQLNVGTYSFTDAAGRHLLGNPKGRHVSLLATILHESGHWIGLAHLPDTGASASDEPPLMGDTYDARMCLGNADADALARAVDQGWDGRLRAPHGLRYPEE